MARENRNMVSSALVGRQAELDLDELCQCCGVPQERIMAYVAEGIVEPEGEKEEPEQWRFSRLCLVEVRRAYRLERDLRLNAAGVALALELMAQIEQLKSRLARLAPEEDHS